MGCKEAGSSTLGASFHKVFLAFFCSFLEMLQNKAIIQLGFLGNFKQINKILTMVLFIPKHYTNAKPNEVNT